VHGVSHHPGFNKPPGEPALAISRLFPRLSNPTKKETTMYDMGKLSNLAKLDNLGTRGMAAFWAFDKAAFEPGALSAREKQLISVAVALTTQCPYCIQLHADAARKEGATDEQLAETALVAAAIRAGGAITHATHLFNEK
jgi:AhpD family alkylhydroperoxidase